MNIQVGLMRQTSAHRYHTPGNKGLLYTDSEVQHVYDIVKESTSFLKLTTFSMECIFESLSIQTIPIKTSINALVPLL